MTQSEYEVWFKRLYDLFFEIHSAFYVWKGLQNKSYNKIFEENVDFWNAVLFSLEKSWLISLANIFEESQYSRNAEVISLYAIMPDHKNVSKRNAVANLLQEHAKVIKAMQVLRHNRYAHNNVAHLLNPNKLLGRFPIKYGKVEKLLGISGQLLSLLSPQASHEYVFQDVAERCSKDSRLVVERIKCYFEFTKILDSFGVGDEK